MLYLNNNKNVRKQTRTNYERIGEQQQKKQNEATKTWQVQTRFVRQTKSNRNFDQKQNCDRELKKKRRNRVTMKISADTERQRRIATTTKNQRDNSARTSTLRNR